jgi:hypothetical protein
MKKKNDISLKDSITEGHLLVDNFIQDIKEKIEKFIKKTVDKIIKIVI